MKSTIGALILLTITLLTLQGCIELNGPVCSETDLIFHITIPYNQSSTLRECSCKPYEVACKDKAKEISYNVSGKVLGDVIPNSTVYLYKVQETSYEVVMETIKNSEFEKHTFVNRSNQFRFNSLLPGNYVFVIPKTSYNKSIGYPLPIEFKNGNHSLDIAFQGGDCQFAAGAFSIE